jgi:arylsulfatase A-like enzyme/Flp pilus assembly protein TadD
LGVVAVALLGMAALFLLGPLGCTGGGISLRGAPIILISVDTLRADRLPAFGYEGIETPHLDALAAESLVFENAYSPCPLTLPSHASLLSGVIPPRHGVRDNLGYRFDPDRHPTLPRLIKQAGYATGAAVSAYVLRADTGLGQAFDHYDDAIAVRSDRPLDRLERRGPATVEAAEEWIREREGQPFFFFLHLFEPHDPYEPPEPYRSRYEDPYDGEIAWTDEILGGFFDFLREQDLYDRSMIIFVSDHGEGLGDHGEARHGLLLYREAIHVPLMVKLPKGRRGGVRIQRPAQLLDIMPTVLEMLRIVPPGQLEGTSLLELAGPGGAELDQRRVFSETLYGRIHYGWAELRSLVGSRFHYIESPNPELFDIVEDPGETRNVLEDERRAFFELRRELEKLPSGFEAPAPADPEEAAQLMALGYLAAAAPETDGPRPDPKENLHIVDAVQRAVDLRASGKYEEAVMELEKLLASNPEVQDAHLLLAPALRALGRYDDALAASRRALLVLPTLEPLISLEMAEIYLAKGQSEQAAAQAALGESADAARSHELRARAALAQGDLTNALAEARRALGAAQPPRLPSLLLAAEIYLLREDFPSALGLLDRAWQRISRGESPPIANLQAKRGDALARLQRYEEAEAAFEDEIRLFPRNPQPYAQLALLYAATRRFERIEPLMERMVEARPDPATYRLAAETLERLGNAEGAEQWRQRAEAEGRR